MEKGICAYVSDRKESGDYLCIFSICSDERWVLWFRFDFYPAVQMKTALSKKCEM